MINKLDIKIKGAAIVGLCIIVMLIAGTLNGFGQGVSVSSEQSKPPEQTYCVQMGYMYTTQSQLNNGQPVCKIDGTWCDANAFYTGQCTASYNPGGLPNPYAAYYGYPQSTSVHTPYGDVPSDASDYSGTITVQGPYYGGYDDPWMSSSGGLSETGSSETAEAAAWAYGAMSFLNAP